MAGKQPDKAEGGISRSLKFGGTQWEFWFISSRRRKAERGKKEKRNMAGKLDMSLVKEALEKLRSDPRYKPDLETTYDTEGKLISIL